MKDENPPARMGTVAIRMLADCRHHLETVARWVWEEWHDHSGLSLEETRLRLDDPPDCPPTLVAEEDGAPVGVLGFQRFVRAPGDPASLFIDVLLVSEPHRRRGIGAALVREGIGRARRLAPDLYVHTSQREWYQRHGFSLLTADPTSGLFVLLRSG